MNTYEITFYSRSSRLYGRVRVVADALKYGYKVAGSWIFDKEEA